MDAALQELGPGVKPADRPLWGKVHPVSVKGKAGTPYLLQGMSRS